MGELFDVSKMERSIKKAKRRSTWKTVFITFAVIVVVGIGSVVVNRIVTPLLEFSVADSFYYFNNISGANEFISTLETFPGILGGENHYKTYKLVEGKVVYTGDGGYGYGLFRNEWLGRMGMSSPLIFGGAYNEESLSKPHYSVLGHRQMTFFYPFVDYEKPSTDLALLEEIGDDKVLEMALSFDKGYTSAEAMALIPKGVTKTWLWVKDVDETELFSTEYINTDGKKIIDALVRNENNVYGFPVIDENGDIATTPVEHFIEHISSGTKFRTRWQGEFKRLNETISGEDGKLSVRDIEIYGMVVTGTASSLAALKNLPFIKASSFGIITDKY